MTGSELVAFLLERRVLEPVHVVDNGVRIVDRRRDRFIVREVSVAATPRAVVKEQADESAAHYLATEALTLEYLQEQPGLACIAPRFYAYDLSRGLLAMQHVDGLPLLHWIDEHGEVGIALLDRFAAVLAALHRESRGGAPVAATLPWVLHVLEPGPHWRPPALAEVRPMVRDPDRLLDATRHARRIWNSECLVHGDLKWEHCLVGKNSEPSAGPLLIDWELATNGDPAWDVASVIAEILLQARESPEQVDRGAIGVGHVVGLPIPRSAHRFVGEYLRLVDEKARRASLLWRTAFFTAVRLFQSSLELARISGGADAYVQRAIRQCETILDDPVAFADGLLPNSD